MTSKETAFFSSLSCEFIIFLEDSSVLSPFGRANTKHTFTPGQGQSPGHTEIPQGFVSPSRLLIKVSSFTGKWIQWRMKRGLGAMVVNSTEKQPQPCSPMRTGLRLVHPAGMGQE